jgi:hypothetical protein
VARALLACLLPLLGYADLSAWAQTCTVCGQVRSVREVAAGRPQSETMRLAQGQPGTTSALDTPPVVGTVARFEFDSGRPDEWHLGSAGTPEMQMRLGEVYYEVLVVMDDGERRTVTRRDGNRFHVGQRVALRSGDIEPM